MLSVRDEDKKLAHKKLPWKMIEHIFCMREKHLPKAGTASDLLHFIDKSMVSKFISNDQD